MIAQNPMHLNLIDGECLSESGLSQHLNRLRQLRHQVQTRRPAKNSHGQVVPLASTITCHFFSRKGSGYSHQGQGRFAAEIHHRMISYTVA